MATMRRLLALDCSTDICSLALWVDGQVVVHREYAARQVSERLLGYIEKLLSGCRIGLNDLDALAVGVGPGAFTGVRLAVATMHGLAMACGLPIHPVSTLAAVAAQTGHRATAEPLLVLQDARMGEVYAGWFNVDASGAVAASSEIVVEPARLVLPAGVDKFNIAGNAFAIFEDVVVAAIGQPVNVFPEGAIAIGVARIAVIRPDSAGRDPEQVEPTYIRNKVALTSAEQLALRGKA